MTLYTTISSLFGLEMISGDDDERGRKGRGQGEEREWWSVLIRSIYPEISSFESMKARKGN